MNISRRQFMRGVSAAAIMISTPANAGWIHGSLNNISPVFNGKKLQVNLNATGGSGDYEFVNALKTLTTWNYRDNSGTPAPDELDDNGYPLPGANCFSHSGLSALIYLPCVANGGSLYAFRITGKGTLVSSGTVATIAISSTTTGNPTIFNFTSGHNFTVGMEMPLSGIGGTLGTQLNSTVQVITGITATTVTINVNTIGKSDSGTHGTATYGRLACGVATGGRVIMDFSSLGLSGCAINPTIGIVATDATTPISNLALVRLGTEESRYNVDPYAFSSDFLNVVRQFGVVRFVNSLLTFNSTETLWSDRKPLTYYSYRSERFMNSKYAGATTSTKNDYAITSGSGAPYDRQQIIVQFDAATISCSNLGPGVSAQLTWTGHGLSVGEAFNIFRTAPSGSAPIDVATGQALVIYSGATIPFYVTAVIDANTITFSKSQGGADVQTSSSGVGQLYAHTTMVPKTCVFTSGGTNLQCNGHVLNVNDPVAFYNGTLPSNINFYGSTYYVKTIVDPNNITISATPGGTAITFSGSGSGTILLVRQPTMNLNGSGALPIKGPSYVTVTTGGNSIPRSRSFGANFPSVGILTYDLQLDSWSLYGGSDIGPIPMATYFPPEICFRLCAQIGAHPYFTVNGHCINTGLSAAGTACTNVMAAGGDDWFLGLVKYCKANQPSWMIPRFEVSPNECWNGNFVATTIGACKAFARWGTADTYNWVGMIGSCNAQVVNSIYGGAIGNGYQAFVGFQTGNFQSSATPTSEKSRVESTLYVAAGDMNNSALAAYKFLTHGCIAQYFRPEAYGTTAGSTWASNVITLTGASISGNTLTTIGSPALVAGFMITGAAPFPPTAAIISGSGNSWTLNFTAPQTISGITLYACDPQFPQFFADTSAGCLFNGTIVGTALTINSFAANSTPPTAGTVLFGSGVTPNTRIVSGSGSSWIITPSQNVGPVDMQSGDFSLPAENQNYTNAVSFMGGYTNNAGHTLKVLGYEGGYSPDYGVNGILPDILSALSKVCYSTPNQPLGMEFYEARNFANAFAAGVEYPSHYLLSGLSPTNQVWTALDDIYQSPRSPIWLGIVDQS